MGLATIPLLILGGALEAVDERLLELPIALLGLGWVILGVALWNAPITHRRNTTVRESPSANPA